MEKEKRVTAYVTDIKTLVIYGDLDGDKYADNWLALCNNQRENKEFLELLNFNGSNTIRAVIDITEATDKEIEHFKEFFVSWGLTITSTTVEEAKKYVIDEYQLNESQEVYLIKEGI